MDVTIVQLARLGSFRMVLPFFLLPIAGGILLPQGVPDIDTGVLALALVPVVLLGIFLMRQYTRPKLLHCQESGLVLLSGGGKVIAGAPWRAVTAIPYCKGAGEDYSGDAIWPCVLLRIGDYGIAIHSAMVLRRWPDGATFHRRSTTHAARGENWSSLVQELIVNGVSVGWLARTV